MIVQSGLGTASLTRAIRTAFNEVLPGMALPAARRAITMDEMIARSIAGQRFNATLAGSFSAMALTLAVIGLFGSVAYSVSQRRHELGVRAALGARPGDLIVMCMRSAMILTTVGIAVGLLCSAYLTRFIEGQLYAVDRLDARTFAGAAVLMIVAAGIAAYWPASRAAHADPTTALRYE